MARTDLSIGARILSVRFCGRIFIGHGLRLQASWPESLLRG
jgi:hypothetical protein